MKGFPSELAQQLETKLFSAVDNGAAEALVHLKRDDRLVDQSARLRSGWTRFLVSLLMRMPEDIQNMREAWELAYNNAPPYLGNEYQKKRENTDPATIEELLADMTVGEREHQLGSIVFRLINDGKTGELIHALNWYVIDVSKTGKTFLTSDRPIIQFGKMNSPKGLLALPIAPSCLFVASPVRQGIWKTRNQQNHDTSKKLAPSKMQIVKMINLNIAQQANRFVYSENDKLLPFVSKNFGVKRPFRVTDAFLIDARRRAGLKKNKYGSS